jgi:hypothetical protein
LVYLRRTTFDQSQGMDKSGLKPEIADREIFHRPLGLRTVIRASRYSNSSHGIFFFSVFHNFVILALSIRRYRDKLSEFFHTVQFYQSWRFSCSNAADDSFRQTTDTDLAPQFS